MNRLSIVLAAATQGISLTAEPATLISWTGSVNNSWSNTANWSLNRLPLPGDSVVINLTDTVNVTTGTQVW